MVNKLMDRIRKLDDWQRNQILVGALHKLDEVDLQGVKEEIERYEKRNKEGEVNGFKR
jgi:hypothetical protein